MTQLSPRLRHLYRTYLIFAAVFARILPIWRLAVYALMALLHVISAVMLKPVPEPGKPRLVGADASHAWFSVYIPGKAGWISIPPTILCRLDQHITLAWGRDYSDVTPLKGIAYGGGQHTLSVSVDVLRLVINIVEVSSFAHRFYLMVAKLPTLLFLTLNGDIWLLYI